jgi:hypothetical protein
LAEYVGPTIILPKKVGVFPTLKRMYELYKYGVGSAHGSYESLDEKYKSEWRPEGQQMMCYLKKVNTAVEKMKLEREMPTIIVAPSSTFKGTMREIETEIVDLLDEERVKSGLGVSQWLRVSR